MVKRTSWCLSLVAVTATGCGLLPPAEPGAADAGADAAVDAPPPDRTPPTTAARPAGGVHRALPAVVLTTDEPATIYYTVDGSAPSTASPHGPSPLPVAGLVAGVPLRYLAADAAGNQEAVRSDTYTVDALGPAAVERLRATATGADVLVTWSPPAATDLRDVVLARVDDVAATGAVDGRPMTPGDDMGTGRVVYVGTAASFTDPAPGPGHHTYVAWARYRSGVYAEGRVAGTRLQPPAQACTLRVDVDTGTAAVVEQPSAWTLAMAPPSLAGGVVEVPVTITSRLAGVAFAPKLVVTGLTATGGAPAVVGASGNLTDGAAAGPFVAFGPHGLAEGGAATRPLRLTTGGASVIDVRCAVVESESLFYAERCATPATDGGGLFDLASGQRLGGLPVPPRFAPVATGCAQWQSLVLSPDGRWLYAGARSGRRVAKLDTTSFAVVATLDVPVATASAAAGRLALDPSGRRLYVGVTDGAHGGGRRQLVGNATLPAVEPGVVEVDAATLTERRRLSFGIGGHLRRLARLAVSPDGRTVAALVAAVRAPTSNSELHLIDVAGWTERDVDPTRAGVQTAPLGTVRGPSLTFAPGGRHLVIGQGNGAAAAELDDIGVLDLRSYQLTTVDHPRGERVIGALALDDRVLLLGQGTYLATLDPASGQRFVSGATLPAGRHQAAAFSRDGRTVIVTGDAGTSLVDLASGVRHALLAAGPRGLHTVAATP